MVGRPRNGILNLLLAAVLLLADCGSSYRVYPGATSVAKDFGDKDAGTTALFNCKRIPPSRLGQPGKEVRIHPH
ncbi:MAG TPA: hypothetical protein VFV34_28245, partial [Blastocatellia bacterium]|nr:hypothetical protein [Blastocatellia bacterium]